MSRRASSNHRTLWGSRVLSTQGRVHGVPLVSAGGAGAVVAPRNSIDTQEENQPLLCPVPGQLEPLQAPWGRLGSSAPGSSVPSSCPARGQLSPHFPSPSLHPLSLHTCTTPQLPSEEGHMLSLKWTLACEPSRWKSKGEVTQYLLFSVGLRHATWCSCGVLLS